ncbi:MAG TPA: hypothetical protein VGC50_17435 [Gammaproteobacteria bacterium]
MKLKDLISDWPPQGWTRGPLAWDNDSGLLKLADFQGPDASGLLKLIASDAQLCRWSTSLMIGASELSGVLHEALNMALGRTLSEAGEIELDP